MDDLMIQEVGSMEHGMCFSGSTTIEMVLAVQWEAFRSYQTPAALSAWLPATFPALRLGRNHDRVQHLSLSSCP